MLEPWMLIAGVLVIVLLAVASYLLGSSDGALDERERQLREYNEKLIDELEYEETRLRAAAFQRAAEAVTVWPHRIDKRADLARHIDSLGSAPDLSAAAAHLLEEEHLAPSPNVEPPEESDREVDAYRHEGFL